MRRASFLLVSVALAGCQGRQAILDPQGPHAQSIATLFWLFLAILGTTWLLTNAAMLLSLRNRKEATDPLADDPAQGRRLRWVVSAAVAVTAFVVIGLTFVSYASQRALVASKPGSVSVQVIGHQWWWEVRYDDPSPDRIVTTANELHIPVGERVVVTLESTDVIHSFWAPNLAGKMDLIPGRRNRIEIQADRPGVYRGQCAEFCGHQHANMALLVIAEPREEFDRWRAAQAEPAAIPEDPERRRGLDIILTKPCVMCHAIRGTAAGGRVAPDLTHLASRRTIAAGTLENTRGNIAAWIVDPQGIKPGAKMPTIKLDPDEIEPVARYLEGLK